MFQGVKCALVLSLLCSSVASASDYAITFNKREVPTNPSSDIKGKVRLEITEHSRDGDTVKWIVDRIEITEVRSAGDRLWEELDPDVDTSDGYWTITHADADNPVATEFDVCPLISGRADEVNHSVGYLDYEFESDTWTGTPMFGGQLGAITYAFTLEGSSTPDAEGEDEPAEIDDVEELGQGAN